ncbi:signal peptidase 22 kDa subunit [Ramaria rubella]|nr:signal peptidase 22 kDa subunit [Ramaria rubella]
MCCGAGVTSLGSPSSPLHQFRAFAHIAVAVSVVHVDVLLTCLSHSRSRSRSRVHPLCVCVCVCSVLFCGFRYKGKSEQFRGKSQEFAFYTFDYEADLTPLFDWNTKQLFLYLSAEYTNAQGVKNDIVLWDRIVRRKRDAKLKIKGVKNKYKFRELSTSFRGVSPANFTLKYNLMPHVGLLTFGEVGRTPDAIPFPRDLSV